MGYNLKALHYCGTHTHIFLKQNCRNCGQGMCGQCVENHEHFCPECLIELNMRTSSYKAKHKVMYTTIAGFIVFCAYLAYHFLVKTLYENPHFWIYAIIAFCLGVSAVTTFYILRNSENYKEIARIPFVGFKLSLIVPVLLVASLVPIAFYLYWLFLLVSKTGKKNKGF